MKNNAALAYSFLLILGDALALTAAFSLAYILRVKVDPRPLVEQIPAFTFLFAVLTVLPLWLLVHAFIGLYNQDVYEKRFSELGRLFIGSFIGILVIIGYDFVSSQELFPARLVPIYGLGLGFGFLLVFRTFARILRKTLFKYGIGISNILIVGNTKASKEIADAINDTRHTGLRVLGVVGGKINGLKHFESFQAAIKTVVVIHGIIQTELYGSQEDNNEILRFAQEHHISYRFLPGNSDMFVGKITVELFAGLPIIAVHQTPLIGWGRLAKRIFDALASLILIIITLPVVIVAAILIKLSGGGPIFFKQKRLTRFNRGFTCYKLRTIKSKYNGMSPEKAFELMGKPGLAKQYRENGDYLPKDPRISALGKILRRTSIDELPQFFNVLKGDISLVGPRALVPQELNLYDKKHTILSIKSGLTGLAQISGRRDISFEERRQLDMYYVQNWSFWLDLVILAKTIRIVLSGFGAQ